jgi:hypothetical protein
MKTLCQYNQILVDLVRIMVLLQQHVPNIKTLRNLNVPNE